MAVAKTVLLNCVTTLNGTDYSTYVAKVELPVTAEDKDTTTYGSAGWKERLGGLKSAMLTIDFLQDYAAASLDATFFPLLGTIITFDVKATSAAASASNPHYSGSLLIIDWKPIFGKVGDVATVAVSWPVTAAITRQIT